MPSPKFSFEFPAMPGKVRDRLNLLGNILAGWWTRIARLFPERFLSDRFARKLVQLGFLLLFLYPFVPLIYNRSTSNPAPTFTSWLLPWDPLLLVGQVFQLNWGVLVIGAPLLLLALTVLLGRFFCGWVCPLGSLLDLFRDLFLFWKKPRRRRLAGLHRRNETVRFYFLIFILAASLVSMQFIGLFSPLVIFQRISSTFFENITAFQQSPLRSFLVAFSLIFLAILGLEILEPRFWCRNLCPLGALLSLFSRFSLLNRRVSVECGQCEQSTDCRRACMMRAIPKDPHDTDYADCVMCLECAEKCPQQGIRFEFGLLAYQHWQPHEVEPVEGDSGIVQQGSYVPHGKSVLGLTRRKAAAGIVAGVAGLAVAPLALSWRNQRGVVRPPGALPEEQFLRTCIVCQECIRVCPTGGLKPLFWEAGLAAMGTPQLLGRQGGCTLNPTCPHLCQQVCPVHAIRPVAPLQFKVGLAEVERSLCLAWDQEVKCLVCVEACPNHAAQVYQERVIVDAQKCTGCGRCENACPVAGSAIRVKPL